MSQNMIPSTQSTHRALVLGATGSFGSTMCTRLLQEGWQVNGLSRNPDTDSLTSDINWFQGDALHFKDVEQACVDCDVIIHAVNPAGYRDWNTLVLPMLENTLQVALRKNACVLMPGNIYNYAMDAGLEIAEDREQHPPSKKGMVRVQMEQRLKEFANQGGHCIVLRCGDFFGANGKSDWFHQAIATKGINSTRLLTPSHSHVGHQWAYLPDVAETMMQLTQKRAQLPNYACFHMRGHWDPDGRLVTKISADIIQQHTGKRPRIGAFPWRAIRVLSPFHRTSKELLEMRYLWQYPLRLDNHHLVEILGTEVHTPWHQALTETLNSLPKPISGHR